MYNIFTTSWCICVIFLKYQELTYHHYEGKRAMDHDYGGETRLTPPQRKNTPSTTIEEICKGENTVPR